ncbi:src kinase-associated phosphoprotein 2 [Geospiza fortis]|uniref:Src kinase-associated phosphoprotein 2 n=1 Tax=Geospiza fortis TaxID=48883 RepID=A0A8N5HYF3_GEOFO|nr:src kinase-associated phosphoprotein 2 [Geospiza fortis]
MSSRPGPGDAPPGARGRPRESPGGSAALGTAPGETETAPAVRDTAGPCTRREHRDEFFIEGGKTPPSTFTDTALPAPVGGEGDARRWLSGRDNQRVNQREASGHSYPIANFSSPSERKARREPALGATFDVETFVSQTLKGENLSKKAKERREALLKKIKDIKASYPQEFPEKELEDEEESENSLSSPPDSVSIASDRYDKEDEAPSDGNQFPPVAAQDLQFILKAGYLEKRRKDRSFLGFEWQKRWCAISKTVFYYYGSDKDKQQKGEFALEGYTIRMNNSLRKDTKKDCCFEISAPDKRIYQFTAATPKEAEEWVQQVRFVIQDMGSNAVPEEEEEEYDDVGQANSGLIDDSIYEEVKEERLSPKAEVPSNESQEEVTTDSDSENTDYANFYVALWDCTGDKPDELTFKRGDVIYIISKEYDRSGWWVGEMKGTIGFVPKAYLMEMYDI